MGLLDRAASFLATKQQQAYGRTITYARGAETATLTAWLGTSFFARSTEDPGASLVTSERDYMIAAADLVIGGSQTVPQSGDRILETVDGEELIFEILVTAGEPGWRYSDQTRQIIRVHTKRVRS